MFFPHIPTAGISRKITMSLTLYMQPFTLPEWLSVSHKDQAGFKKIYAAQLQTPERLVAFAKAFVISSWIGQQVCGLLCHKAQPGSPALKTTNISQLRLAFIFVLIQGNCCQLQNKLSYVAARWAYWAKTLFYNYTHKTLRTKQNMQLKVTHKNRTLKISTYSLQPTHIK